MKPFWKNSRKKKTKNPSTPPQQKPRTRAKPKSMEEPWKPPMAVPPKAMGQERTPIDIWRDFIVMVACAMSNTVDKAHYDEREKRYLEIINKYEESQQHIFPKLYAAVVLALDENPEQDFLGEMFMDLHLDYEELKQIFTPYHVCQLMADITMDDLVEQIDKQGYVSINDCCCGAGANLIAAINSARRKLEDAGLNF